MKAGDEVNKGDVMMTVEGMKMEVRRKKLKTYTYIPIIFPFPLPFCFSPYLLSFISFPPFSFLPFPSSLSPSPLFSAILLFPFAYSFPFSPPQTNIMAAQQGKVQSVLYKAGDNVPAFSTVIEFQDEDSSSSSS